VQGGYGAVFAVQVQILLSITRVAVQFWSEPENSHGVGFLLQAGAGVRVQVSAGSVLGAGFCKNHDDLSRKAGNNLPILSVLWAMPFLLFV
jgi:hypothetical protein